MGEETLRTVPATRRWGKQERGSTVPQSSSSSFGWFSRWYTPSMCGKRMATHKTGKCPVGKHGVPIFSQWRSAATAYRRPSPCLSEKFFPLLSKRRGGMPGRHRHPRKAFPACGCICFSPLKQQCPSGWRMACRVLPCLGAYFRSNWIV
jgi:hypothetical protein